MLKQGIARSIAAVGLEDGRILRVDDSSCNGFSDHWVIKPALIATRRNGVVWRGDLDLTQDAYKLRRVAQEIDENVFVVDEKGYRIVERAGRSKSLIREAIWWSARGYYEKDEFIGISYYDASYPQNRRRRKAQAEAGSNWASKIRILREGPEGSASVLAHSLSNETPVEPLFIQKTALYDLIWFTNGEAILQQDFEVIRKTFGDVKFCSGAEGAFFVCQNSKLVAVLEPSPVPNRETVEAARHEIALRILPRSQEGIIELVKDHFRLYRGEGAEQLWCSVERLISALDGYNDYSYTWVLRGLTEWGFCRQVELVDACHMFRETKVPVSRLFYAFLRGNTVRGFLRQCPEVTKQQVESVLEHIIQTIDL